MNKKLLNSRFYQITTVVIILMLLLCIRLFMLTILQNQKWVEAAENQNTKEVVTSAPRGEIFDRYGRLLAGNKQIFTITFNVSGLSTTQINNSAYNLTKLLEENGDEYVDNFPIEITKKGNFRYTFDVSKKDWLKKQEFPEDFTAEQAFNALRIKYEIDPTLDKYEALTQIQEEHGIYPPISVRSMTYTYDSRKETFLTKYGIDTTLNSREAFAALRKKYSIDETLTDEDARKIFIVREEIKSLGYNKYQSSTIATDVCDKTVAYVEEMSDLLLGVEVGSETVRYYPEGKLLSHVLGYMGSIADTQYQQYVTENGYSADDLIGKDGIEASMETYLRGKDGIKSILVNSGGDYIETISQTAPVAGKNIYLTVDMDLQKVAEDTLEKVIKTVQTGGIFKSKYGNLKLSKYKNCASGAVVALDVETGDVLAMASYPDYDPNIFAEGISTEDWASVQSTNPRDSLAPIPLYNNATRTSVQPGSTFKPITAVAALQCGLDPNRRIYDKGYIKVGDRTFGCSVWNAYRGSHGSEILRTGIQNSCNYYFYCIASGKDWNTGASLGYKTDISIEKIMEVAAEFGLGEKTGIELSESTTSLASAEKKLQSMKSSLWSYLYYNASKYWPSDIVDDDETLRAEISSITSWMDENPGRSIIISRMKEQTSVRESKVETLSDICKYSYFNQAQWTIGDEFNIAIGQGDNAYTPLQMVNYIATLGNDGKRNQVNIVKGIEGEGETKKPEAYEIDASASDLNEVLEGMKLVAKRGTLASCFSRFPIEVAGKTGTAQKDGYINPIDEVEYVKSHLKQITSAVTWSEVKKKMNELMESDPEKYPTQNDAVDTALISASGSKVTQSQINRFKEEYDNFAWTVTLAPADNPKIAVVVLLIQGGISSNAAPVAREVVGEYLQVDKTYGELDFSADIN